MASAELQRELRRRQTLQALGVVELVPRFVLPGAAPSPQAPVPPVAAAEPAGIARSPLSSAARALPEPDRQQPVLSSPAAKPAHSRAVVGKASRAAPLSLALCRAESWLVLEAGPAPDRPYQRLLANVLRSCGLAGATMEIEHFLWPPPGRLPPHLDATTAGGEVLCSRLQALHQRQPLERMLLLGRGLPSLSGVLEAVKPLAVPVGLWTALEQPEAKRQLWLALDRAGWLA